MWRTLRNCQPQVRSLLTAGFFFNLAFYMVIPYLAWHLRENLLLSTGAIGLLLGTRHIFQQGLFVLGGHLADKYGGKTLLLWGCWLRVVGLILLALGEHLIAILFAILLTGFSAALFMPAAQAALAGQARLSGQSVFALASTFRSAGELGGPLLGLLLIQLNFSYLCLFAALPFAWFGIALQFQHPIPTQTGNNTCDFRHSFKNILKKKRFIAFCIVMSGYFILINQLSFILPLALQQHDGSNLWIGMLFFISAAVGVSTQFLLSRWCEKNWPPSRVLEYGFLIMGTAFFLPLLYTSLPHQLYLILLLVSGLVLTLGMLMCYPVIMQQVSLFGDQANTATHYGIFYLFAGIGMALGNATLGILADAASDFSVHFSAWIFLVVLSVVIALSVRFQARYYDNPRAEVSHA